MVLSPPEEKKEVLGEVAYSYIKKDILEANVRSTEIFYKLFKVLASQVGGLVNSSELASTLGVSKTSVDNYLWLMQKSFHLALLKPFFKNIRKELTKMPKVYFLDLGLRNFFSANFQPFLARGDKGPLLENAVFRQFLEKYDIEEIKFWRTTQGKEIDFVVGNRAVEVKTQPSKIKVNRYQQFLKTYSSIRLDFVSLEGEKEKAFSFFQPWEI